MASRDGLCRTPDLLSVGWVALFRAAVAATAVAATNLWLGELIDFLRPQLAALSAVLTLWALFGRRPIRLFVCLALVAINAWPLVMPDLPKARRSSAAHLRLLTANVEFDNTQVERFRKLISDVQPDIVVLQEATAGWRSVVGTIPGYSNVGRIDALPWNGIAVISRVPLRSSRVDSVPIFNQNLGGGAPLRVEIDRPAGAPLVVYAVHPPTPRTAAGLEARNIYLNAIAARAGKDAAVAPTIVAGDWNTPSWSQTYAAFFRMSGLRSAIGSKWPDPTRMFSVAGIAVFGVPIDHVAVSANIAIARVFVGPDFGSDHRPVIADISVVE